MAITLVGTQTASATTVTVPAHQAGDLILIAAERNASATSPTLPSGFVSILTIAQGANVSMRVGYKIATGTSDTSGTWTNAAEITCHVYRPSSGYTLGIGTSATSSSTTTTVNYPALTLADGGGNSWVVGFAAGNNTTQSLSTAPSGMTNESTIVGGVGQIAGHDTEGGVASWSSTNVTAGVGNSVSSVIEIMLLPGTAATSLSSYVYQHVKGGGNPFANNAASTTPFKYTVPVNWTCGAGNTLIIQISYDGGVAAPTCSGSVNGAFTAGPTALGGVGNTDTLTFYKQNLTAGQETVTFTFGVSTRQFGVDAITELYSVATTGGTQGTASSAFSTTTATGSFTPTNNNATGGNFIWSSFVVAEQIPVGTTPNIWGSSPFTLMGVDTAWNDSGGDGEMFAKAQQGYLQATSAAINPAITVIGQGGDHWNSIAMAFKVSSGSGTAPPAKYLAGVSFMSTTHWPASGTFDFQVCATGDLRVIQSPDPNLNALTVSDSEGNIWQSDGTAKPAFWFSQGTSPNPNLQIFITGGGTDTTLSWRFFDVVGAAYSPFDSAVNVADSIAAVTTYTPTNKISPSNTSGLVFYGIGLGLGPGLGVTAPSGAVWQSQTFTGELDSDLAVNADIDAYYQNTATGSITATFTITSNAGNSSSGGIIAFVWSTGAGIVSQPADQTVFLGQTATFNVTGFSTGGTLSYQWQKFVSGSWSNVGTNSTSYTTPATGFSDNGALFRVQVTDSNGTTNSVPAVLTVIGTASFLWLKH